MQKSKIIYKYNGGSLTILCSKCSKIIKTRKNFTEQELEDVKVKYSKLPAQYCETCKIRRKEELI